MEKEFSPPLPDPAENQPPEARRVMGQRLIKQARHELDTGDRLQAGEKAWGAVVQFLKIIGERRGWGHTSNRQLQSLGSHLAAEYPEHGAQLATALSNAYHKGHENFYENRRRRREVREAVEGVEEVLPVLESLASEEPRPFTIESNSQLRRLRVLTGNDELQVGDESDVGFSLRHGYGPNNQEQGLIRERPGREPGQLQPIVRRLMTTLLEDYPDLLSENERRNLMDADYCRDRLGLKLGGLEILRPIEEGNIVSGHSRYWAQVYGGRYYVTNNWWKQHHSHNAISLLNFVEELIGKREGHPGVAALEKHREALQGYLAGTQL